MIIEVISIGTELLLGQITNTNAKWLSAQCAKVGLSVYHQQVVGDNMNRLVAALKLAQSRADFVICTGGLGPTEDDISREALAVAAGVPLVTDSDSVDMLIERFQRSGRPMPKNNMRQTLLPEGAEAVPNAFGTAPGVWLENNDVCFLLLPGPPREMRAMFEQQVIGRIKNRIGTLNSIVSRSIRCVGIGESACAEELSDLIAGQTEPTIALYAHVGEVEIRLTAQAEDEASAYDIIGPVEHKILKRMQGNVYGYDDDSLTSVVAEMLSQQGLKIAVAESCTGGLLAHHLTMLPGSSRFFDRGIVVYSNQAKQDMLGVPNDILTTYGAVSANCASSMVAGLLQHTSVDIAVAITGIAGPGGGTNDKPVGTVFVSLASGSDIITKRFLLLGDRYHIQLRSVKHALNMIRTYLEGDIK